MISYVIQQARPSDDCRDNNIVSEFSSCDKAKLDEEIINYIIQVMYEFCSKEYGHGIQITSYDDFCDNYWKNSGFEIRYWCNIFRVKYYENNQWLTWKVDDFKEKIYNTYVNKYNNK